MKDTTRIPRKVIENWFKELTITLIKEYKHEDPDPEIINKMWNDALPYLEVEYNTWVDSANPVETCEKCGHMKFITKE